MTPDTATEPSARLTNNQVALAVLVVIAILAVMWTGREAYRANQLSNEMDRLVRNNYSLLDECRTPSPKPGEAKNAADRVHECYDDFIRTAPKKLDANENDIPDDREVLLGIDDMNDRLDRLLSKFEEPVVVEEPVTP